MKSIFNYFFGKKETANANTAININNTFEKGFYYNSEDYYKEAAKYIKKTAYEEAEINDRIRKVFEGMDFEVIDCDSNVPEHRHYAAFDIENFEDAIKQLELLVKSFGNDFKYSYCKSGQLNVFVNLKQ